MADQPCFPHGTFYCNTCYPDHNFFIRELPFYNQPLPQQQQQGYHFNQTSPPQQQRQNPPGFYYNQPPPIPNYMPLVFYLTPSSRYDSPPQLPPSQFSNFSASFPTNTQVPRDPGPGRAGKNRKRKRHSTDSTHSSSSSSASTSPPLSNSLPNKKRVKRICLYDNPSAEDYALTTGKSVPLHPNHQDYIRIKEYIQISENSTFQIEILDIHRILPLKDQPNFNDNPITRNKTRMMLWHGTKRKFVPRILDKGLRIPLHNHVEGLRYGAGIYFSDSVAHSAKFCDGWGRYVEEGCYLILTDVILEHTFDGNNGEVSQEEQKEWEEKGSVKVCGYVQPDPKGDKKINGSIWPLGTETMRSKFNKKHANNNYVVYNKDLVRMKFLVKVRFNNFLSSNQQQMNQDQSSIIWCDSQQFDEPQLQYWF